MSWPRRFDKTTIWSLRVFQARASKQSCKISVAAFLVPATSPASLICFSTFSNCSIAASKFPVFAYKKFTGNVNFSYHNRRISVQNKKINNPRVVEAKKKIKQLVVGKINGGSEEIKVEDASGNKVKRGIWNGFDPWMN